MYTTHNQLFKHYLEPFKIIYSILGTKYHVDMCYLLQTEFYRAYQFIFKRLSIKFHKNVRIFVQRSQQY